jgi:hypothetical protein
MINKYCVLLFGLLAFSCSQKNELQETSFKRYPFKSVHVKYEITGDGVGTEDLYIDDYGRYELIKSDYISGITQQPTPNNHTLITRLADMYSTTPNSATGRTVHIRVLDSLYKLTTNIPSYSIMVERTLNDGKFQLEGTEVIAGILTQRWKQVMGPVTINLYNGLILKRVIDGQNGAVFVQTAIKVDTLWNSDTNLFSLPKGITFKEGPENQPGGQQQPPPFIPKSPKAPQIQSPK